MRMAFLFLFGLTCLVTLVWADPALAQWNNKPTPPATTPAPAPAPLIGFGIPFAGLVIAAAWAVRRYRK
jgi:hypothetical protein